MIRILFLDDSPGRHRTMQQNAVGAVVDHVYTANEALEHLARNEYDLIMLDHDLDEHDDTPMIVPDGTYVAEYMAHHLVQHSDTPVVIHSLNHPAAENMMNILLDGGYSDVHAIPFAWQKIRVVDAGVFFERSE